jgi:hypothetical protein
LESSPLFDRKSGVFRKVTKKSDSGYKVTIYDVREGPFKEAFERLRSNIQEKGIEPLMIPWDRLEAIKTCDNRTPHAENCSFVYYFLNPVFSSIVIVIETKSDTSKL